MNDIDRINNELYECNKLQEGSFELALQALKQGYKIQRESWLPTTYVTISENIIIKHHIDTSIFWIILAEDILAMDWKIIRSTNDKPN